VKIIILGAGQVGRTAAFHLSREEANDVTVIDLNEDILRDLQDRLDIRTVNGNASSPRILEAAGIASTDILVALLPLTPQTRGMLNARLFGKLASDGRLGGPILLNAGRGGLQVETDILAALDDGVLKAASLDVFEVEPLPKASPLWRHPRVTISPHNAAISTPDTILRAIVEQIAAHERGEPLRNVVDRKRGY